METITHNPAEIYSSAPDYAHGLEVRGAERLLFVSGTMGLDPQGKALGSLEQQLSQIWVNIGAILAAASMGLDNVVRVTSYLKDPADADANAKARVVALGGRRVPTTAIVAGHLENDWLIEIEVMAAA